MIHKTDTHKFYSQNLDPQEWSQNLDSLNYFTKFIFTDMIHKIETQIKDSQKWFTKFRLKKRFKNNLQNVDPQKFFTKFGLTKLIHKI